MSGPVEITPTGSRAQVFLDTTPLAPSQEINIPDDSQLRADAVQKLMADFGFTEAMARAIVGT